MHMYAIVPLAEKTVMLVLAVLLQEFCAVWALFLKHLRQPHQEFILQKVPSEAPWHGGYNQRYCHNGQQ